MPRSSVSPSSSGTDVKFCKPGHCETSCGGDNFNIDELTTQTEFHINSEVHRELRTHFNLPPHEFARVKQSQLKKLLFYRLVHGGNIVIVSSVLDEIRQADKALHDYLIRGKLSNGLPQRDKQNKSASCFFVLISLIIYSLIMIPLFIITTPIFYTLHSLFVSMYMNRKISKFSKYPLLFAAMSNSQPMLQLFAEHLPSILFDTDKEGNNIFHYLAEVSIKKPQRAIQCFKLIEKTFALSQIRNVLLEAKNFNGLTALEQSMQKGSPLYFTVLLETHGILKSTALVISEESVSSNRMTTHAFIDTSSVVLHEMSSSYNYEESNKSSHIAGKINAQNVTYKLFHYDITKYEQGDAFGDNSFLLTLLTRRDLTAMSDSEIESIVSSPLLTQWMRTKIKSMITMRSLQFIVTNILSLAFGIYAATIGGTDNPERLIISFWSTVEQLAIENETDIFDTQYKISSNATGVSFHKFISPALEVLNAACGVDVSHYLPNGNMTDHKIGDIPSLIVNIITIFILFISMILILSDIYLRLVFLTKNFFHSGWKEGHQKIHVMIRHVLARPMQVSYVERQLSLSSSVFCGIMMYCLFWSRQIEAIDVDSANEKSILRAIGMMLAVACFSSRFFVYLYSLRAQGNMSVAGRLVLTMCKMFSFVIEFSWVYFWISAFFAGIFMFVVHDPVCTYKDFYPFDTWPNSMMGVFRLMLSDNVLPDRPSMEAIFAYFIYIFLTTIVVLSLVTGISGSIADKVLSKRLIGILQDVESLESAIEVESALCVGPLRLFKYFHIKRMKGLQKLKTIIDKQSNILKVAIEVESCIPLEPHQN